MPAARRVARDRPVTGAEQAIELLWAERDRVKMGVLDHARTSKRFRSGVSPLPHRTAPLWDYFNVAMIKSYVPWVRGLNLNVVLIDGDTEVIVHAADDMADFVFDALKRRKKFMTDHIRACAALGRSGGRGPKDIRMRRASDMYVESILTHVIALEGSMVLRGA